ncbi:acyl-CoA dehydrogenase [Verticiella sediminum]|uniref:Acyl-CoA dehydrogenase n=1 Tax=Verticiella sediminum TaxID=1247510 RepID=A0A556AWP3_9BURK|nr:acyl-CoA dehydrogenase family protein [Verticiella sediminum]TSH97373.1 acyl-CoA dehydrogenase [Verticiella sediminum]
MFAAEQYETFQNEVRDFVLAHCPAGTRRIVAESGKLTRTRLAEWQRILYERGWGAPSWPKAYGGTGWDVWQRHIFDEVLAECDCPPQYHHGLRHIGPVLIEYGTPEQQQRFLPGILRGEDWWCQGYSEPGSGSDLASLKTAAQREGDVYRVSGQKIWTSHAHEADLMYTLVRTASTGRKQEGITMLLIPMDAPGLSVRPIRTIDGWHHVNEVFLDDVRVPVANRVGEQDRGWEYGKFLLSRERLGSANVAPLFQLLERTKRLVASRLEGPAEARRREHLALRLLMAEAEIVGQRELGVRAIEDVVQARPLGLAPSALKMASSRLMQQVSEIAFEVLGPTLAGRFGAKEGEVEDMNWLQSYLFFRARTIVGGTNEVQKNVIAKALFGD